MPNPPKPPPKANRFYPTLPQTSDPALGQVVKNLTTQQYDLLDRVASIENAPAPLTKNELSFITEHVSTNIQANGSNPVSVQNLLGTIPAQTAPPQQFANGINSSGILSFAQPTFSGTIGVITAAQEPATTVNSVSNDTNVTGVISAQNLTLGWTGTLAAGRLNPNVVQIVTNDTNITGSIAAQTLTLGFTGTLAVARGGTGSGTANGGFNNLSPMTTLGDIIYENATPAATRLAGNTTTTKKFLTQTGTGSVSAAPAWGTVVAGDLPSTTVNNVVNDTNVTGSIATQALTLGWTGTLAKTRTLATTVYTDQANTFSSSFTQTFSGPVVCNATTASNILSVTGTLNGGSGQAAINLSSTVSNTGQCFVMANQPTISGTGTTNLYSYYVAVTLAASATLTTAYGLFISTPSLGASATINTVYGVRILAQAGTGITTAKAISQEGASDTNTFAGVSTFTNTLAAQATTNLGSTAQTSVNSSGLVTKYNNVATVQGGVPGEYAAVHTTGLTANVASTLLYAVPASPAFLYRVSAQVVLTTAASVSSTLPNIQLVYTDADSNTTVTLDVTPVLGSAGSGQSGALTANTVGLTAGDVIPISAKASTNINYQTTGYLSSAAGMAYSIRLVLEGL